MTRNKEFLIYCCGSYYVWRDEKGNDVDLDCDFYDLDDEELSKISQCCLVEQDLKEYGIKKEDMLPIYPNNNLVAAY